MSNSDMALPLAYRPNQDDDWGFIRDAAGSLVMVVRGPSIGDVEMDRHRAEGTDPFEARGREIVRAVNARSKLLAYAECEQAWTDWASGEATHEQVENVLRRHGWIEGKDPEDFVDGLRRDGLAAAKGETTPC